MSSTGIIVFGHPSFFICKALEDGNLLLEEWHHQLFHPPTLPPQDMDWEPLALVFLLLSRPNTRSPP